MPFQFLATQATNTTDELGSGSGATGSGSTGSGEPGSNDLGSGNLGSGDLGSGEELGSGSATTTIREQTTTQVTTVTLPPVVRENAVVVSLSGFTVTTVIYVYINFIVQ